MLKRLIGGVVLAIALGLGPALCGEPVFHATFDDGLSARTRDHGIMLPVQERGTSLDAGVSGTSVTVPDGQPVLKYDAKDYFQAESGTVMFWYRPGFDRFSEDGTLNRETRQIFLAIDKTGKPVFNMFNWSGLRVDLRRAPGLKPLRLLSSCRRSMFKGSWWHVALVWNDNGWVKLYIDGVPHDRMVRKSMKPVQDEVCLQGITHFFIGSFSTKRLPKTAQASFDEFRIFGRALSSDEINSDYRSCMPFDIIMERHYIPAGKTFELQWELHPANRLREPACTVRPDRAEAVIHVALTDRQGKTITKQAIPVAVKEEIVTCSLACPALAPGNYRLALETECAGKRVTTVLPVVVYPPLPAQTPSREDLRTGEPFFTIDCTTEKGGFVAQGATSLCAGSGGERYREAGTRKMSRFSYDVVIPEQVRGKGPVVLDVYWPDDKPRSMGLYLYVESGPDQRQHRDRLEAGIQSGNEFPVSGEVQRTRYLFYPEYERYLFEARTKISGYPAAVLRVEFKPVIGRLPKLAVTTPAGDHRMLGNWDEDQTFAWVMHHNREKMQTLSYHTELLDRLMDYLDYAGLDCFSYDLLRYQNAWIPLPGGYSLSGSMLGKGGAGFGWIMHLLDRLHEREKTFIAIVNLRTLPETAYRPDLAEAYRKDGVFIETREGNVIETKRWGCVPDATHPFVRERFLFYIEEVLRRYGKHPAMVGLDMSGLPSSFWLLQGLDNGYGDATVRAFGRDTGCAGPGLMTGKDRFSKRYDYLTGPKRAEWLRWRAGVNTDLFRQIDGLVKQYAPRLRLLACFSETLSSSGLSGKSAEDIDMKEVLYAERGVDLDALAAIPSVVIAPIRRPTSGRWLEARHGGENVSHELLYTPQRYALYRQKEGAHIVSYMGYFESFNDSLKPTEYASYFQNADVKAHGRFFLQEWAFNMAVLDPHCMVIGGQPLGVAGRLSVTREFAANYSALPAQPFRDVPGETDPVTVRYGNAEDGTYLYAVNTGWFDAAVAIRLAEPVVECVDLAEGKKLPLKDNVLSVTLPPYGLRSFKIPAVRTHVTGYDTHLPPSVQAWCARQVADKVRQVEEVEASGTDASLYRLRVDAMRDALGNGRFVETQRLLFSKTMRDLDRVASDAAKGYLARKRAMTARSHYAINCGSGEFRAIGDSLYFPDQPFTNGFGHMQNYRRAGRSVSAIEDAELHPLFASEAYNIDGYRFAVAPGVYTVKLHMKVGYAPSLRPGKVLFSIDINGKKVLDTIDLFERMGKTAGGYTIEEFKGIAVPDGTLDVMWTADSNVKSSARLCNAIEVVPE